MSPTICCTKLVQGQVLVLVLRQEGAAREPGQRHHLERTASGLDALRADPPQHGHVRQLQLAEDVHRGGAARRHRDVVVAGHQDDLDVLPGSGGCTRRASSRWWVGEGSRDL